MTQSRLKGHTNIVDFFWRLDEPLNPRLGSIAFNRARRSFVARQAFVLKYRTNETADDEQEMTAALAKIMSAPANPGATPSVSEPRATADAQAALAMVRARAGEWRVDPSRVGMMGWTGMNLRYLAPMPSIMADLNIDRASAGMMAGAGFLAPCSAPFFRDSRRTYWPPKDDRDLCCAFQNLLLCRDTDDRAGVVQHDAARRWS